MFTIWKKNGLMPPSSVALRNVAIHLKGGDKKDYVVTLRKGGRVEFTHDRGAILTGLTAFKRYVHEVEGPSASGKGPRHKKVGTDAAIKDFDGQNVTLGARKGEEEAVLEWVKGQAKIAFDGARLDNEFHQNITIGNFTLDAGAQALFQGGNRVKVLNVGGRVTFGEGNLRRVEYRGVVGKKEPVDTRRRQLFNRQTWV